MEKYNARDNEVPLMDLRIVDNIEIGYRWITKAIDKFTSLTESIYDNDNCPSGIPHHNCPRSKEITINNRYVEPPQYVTEVIFKGESQTLVNYKEVDNINIFDHPHPSNHDW